MKERFIDTVYQTVIGELQPEYRLPGVEDAFATGGICDQAYEQMCSAYDSLLARLGCANEDKDIETIIYALTVIQKEIAYQMYRYGVHFGIPDQIL